MGNVYSVMLVDDEEDVAQAILHKLDWDKMGFEIPTYAHNGFEALEMAENNMPDVIMTDIKMPYMDGLELGRQIKQLNPGAKIIIFSGFDEFEYAKEAIRLEAEEYILKPVDALELQNVFTRIHNTLDKETDEKQNVEKLTSYYLESLPLLQEDFFSSLIEGRLEKNKIQRYAKDYQVDFHGPLYEIAVIHTSQEDNPDGMNPMLKSVAVRRYAQERFGDRWDARFFSYQSNTAVILQIDSEDKTTEITDEFNKFCMLAGNVCKANVTVGVGKVCNDPSDFPASYNGAREAVSYRALYGTRRAINIAEIVPQESARFSDDGENELHEIFREIRIDDEDGLDNAIREYVKTIVRTQSSMIEHKASVTELISELYRFSGNNHVNLEESFGKDNDIITKVIQMEPSEVTLWLRSVCSEMQRQVRSMRTETTRSFVTNAIEYIHDHYSEADLSIDSICSYLGVSSAYFSTVFKKETGKTFVGYVTEYRMNAAARLITENNEKTYVIAGMVGFSDPNYFSYVFKKRFGMSPSKYNLKQDGEKA
ncbi:MAG: response regulator [Lachnospiraceae bacterium]|nr:response regulator [Lachnospiraceae bacterium]